MQRWRVERLSRRIVVGAVLLLVGCATARRAPPQPALTAPPQPASTAPTVRPRIGLALGAGGARGFAQIGVLRVLEQERVPIDVVAGASVGSLVGALYADTGRVLDAEFHAVTVEEEDVFDYKALAFFSGGLVKGERLRRLLETELRQQRIEQMAVRFAAVATDLGSGRAVVFDRGPVALAVHASCAIPGVFVPVTIDGATYVDGGVVDPVPVDVARRLGADVVIAVAIPGGRPKKTPRNAIEVALFAVTIMSAEIGALRARDADVVIAPDVGDVNFDDFSQKKRLIEAGETATRAALPAIRAAIAAKSGVAPAAATAPPGLP